MTRRPTVIVTETGGGSEEDARWVRGLYNRRLPRAWKSIRLKTEYKSVAQ